MYCNPSALLYETIAISGSIFSSCYNNDCSHQVTAIMFEACSKPWLIEPIKRLLLSVTTGERDASILGTAVSAVTQKTVFRHFCAGETITDCARVATELEASNIGVIVDHSKEVAEGMWQVNMHTIVCRLWQVECNCVP